MGRKRSRSRSRSPRRKRSRSPKKHKKSSRDHKRRKSRSKSPDVAKIIGDAMTTAQNVAAVEAEKDTELKKLELEMQKRKDRIEKWRELKKVEEEKQKTTPVLPGKLWSLDAEDDDDEDNSGGNKTNEEEVDPLDAYMESLTGSVPNVPKDEKVVQKVTFLMSERVVKDEKQKGELLENVNDQLDFLGEAEKEDGIESALAKINARKMDQIHVNHDKVYYRPFKKDFYHEVPEISKMTKEDVIEMRYLLDNIKVRGKNIPKPISTFGQCGVSAKVLEICKRNNFLKPTSIQCQAIPIIMSGRDMIGIAKTGSGKTLAFLIPMFRHIADQEEIEDGDGPIGLILSPTRELAIQTTKEIKKFSNATGINPVCVYGGTGISEQIGELKKGTEIVVCTPGRFIDMLAANNGKVTNLRRITYVVLDEVDRLFDLGFEPQVTSILQGVRPDKQLVMFSATFPRNMESLARKFLTKPIEIEVGGRDVVCSDVTQCVAVLEDNKKFLKLLELLGQHQQNGSVIVFVEKQENADDLMKELMKFSYPCLALHGGIDQNDRDSVMTDFKKGNVKLLVATSVAARGLDVKDMILVVNYDCPNHYEDYVHRCGRTGRAGKKGFAWTFLTPEQTQYAGHISKAFELSGLPIPPELTELWKIFQSEMEAKGKKAKLSGGFNSSCKGFTFSNEESDQFNEMRKAQKIAHGLNDSDDDDDDNNEKTNEIASKIDDLWTKTRKRVTDVSVKLPQQANEPVEHDMNTKQKLELARLRANQVNLNKVMQANQKSALPAGSGLNPSVGNTTSKKDVAKMLADRLNRKMGYTPSSSSPSASNDPVMSAANPFDNAGNQCQYFEQELEINDFPQQVRYRLTSKEVMHRLLDLCECGLSVKGTYYDPKKFKNNKEEMTDRKLYLLIEATNEASLNKGKKEIKSLIKEELVRVQEYQIRQMSLGRFKTL